MFYFVSNKYMFIVYGSKRKLIGAEEAFLYACPYCEQRGTTTVAVFSKYLHIFWIPVFAYSKETHAVCSHCNASRGDNKFGPELLKYAQEIEVKFRHPFYLYALTILVALLFVAIIIIAPKS